jgi:hypothetical protein
VTDTENEITADLIAELLDEQHPDLADLPLTFGARGWDNQLWRLGDHLAVRLPWATQGADELLLKELRATPQGPLRQNRGFVCLAGRVGFPFGFG